MRHMALHDHPFGVGGTWDQEQSEGRIPVGEKRKRDLVPDDEAEIVAKKRVAELAAAASGGGGGGGGATDVELSNGHI